MADGEPRKILVVDDEEGVRQSLQMLLRGEGFEVLEAADGRRVIERVGEEGIDLVIMDILMPNKEGIETIIELQRKDRSLPIIAISGATDALYLEVAYWMGARRTFKKPFDVAALVRAVNEELVKAARERV